MSRTELNAELDDFHQHEVVHMANFLANAVCNELESHPFIEAHPDLKELATQAVDTLMDLYQRASASPVKEDK